MLEPSIRRKLDSLRQLPTIPFVISEVLSAVDNVNMSAASLANLIERDQTLTARVLAVANSPFYGFTRRISTIDLAIVLMGLNAIKEIVLSLVLQRFFSVVSNDDFDVKSFWYYSVYCGASSRYLARKLRYRIAGEAFVAGLMHDIGILILIQNFSKQFLEIRRKQFLKRCSFVHAEKLVIKCTHADIGAWLAERWNLPEQLCNAIRNHHSLYVDQILADIKNLKLNKINTDGDIEDKKFNESEQPLTILVAASEWLATEMGFKQWAKESSPSPLYLPNSTIVEIQRHDVLKPESAFEVIKQEILEEYNKAAILNELPSRPLY